jgi:isopenicillin N synthase-like dioxygenase
MTPIPTIDVASSVAGYGSQGVVADLRDAMATVGFLQIVGHGVPLRLIDRAHDTIEQIDAMPPARRQQLMRPRAESRGVYEKWSSDGRLLQRGFQFVPYDTVDDAEAAGAVRGHPDYFAPNVWPADDPAFKVTWDEYSTATRRLGRTLISLFARALDADPDEFEEAFRHDVTLFSANWYPRQLDPTGPDDVLLAAHADSGALTVLHQRGSYEGLQVLARDGSWQIVGLRPEAFVINIGWLMNRWTDGRWPATTHRVVASANPADRRSSIAMHFLPNIDHVVTPLSTMTGDDGPRYDPISTYDWQREFMANYVLATHDWAAVGQTT